MSLDDATANAASQAPAPKPTFTEVVSAELPRHAYIETAMFHWQANWTTGHGAWSVRRRTDLIRQPEVKIAGPNCVANLVNPTAVFVLTILREVGAIPAFYVGERGPEENDTEWTSS